MAWDELDLEVAATYSLALNYAVSQAEECFCDFVGLWVFGESFPRAMEYFLSPSWGVARSPGYPSLRVRAAYIEEAARVYGIDVSLDFTDQFDDQPPASHDATLRYLVDLADTVIGKMYRQIIDLAKSEASRSGLKPPSDESIRRAFSSLERMCPIEGAESLPAIVAAGWRAALHPTLWAEYSHVADRDAVLRDIVIKSVEVLQMEALLGASS